MLYAASPIMLRYGNGGKHKFQKEQGEQEYTMIYEIDLPKILKAFTEQFPNCV